MNRRSFLKILGGAAVGLAAAKALPAEAPDFYLSRGYGGQHNPLGPVEPGTLFVGGSDFSMGMGDLVVRRGLSYEVWSPDCSQIKGTIIADGSFLPAQSKITSVSRNAITLG